MCSIVEFRRRGRKDAENRPRRLAREDVAPFRPVGNVSLQLLEKLRKKMGAQGE
jgi:hypothetical protein